MAKTKPRTTKQAEMVHIGQLPNWKDIESYEDEKFPQMLNDALRHYGYFYAVPALHKNLVTWLELNSEDASIAKAFKKTLDWRTPSPAYSLAMASMAGMPMKDDHFDYIMDKVNAAIAASTDDIEAIEEKAAAKKANKVKAPSIQDRITAKVNEHILFIEESWEDGIIERKEKHPAPEIKAYLATQEVPPSTVGRIVDHFQAQLDEIVTAKAKDADEDYKEAYAHIKPADLKRYVTFYNALIVDMNMYKEQKKVAKAPRRRKEVSRAKVVAKMKYQKSHDKLKLVSINPETIIDCKTLWVYNTKYRKIGVFHAESHSTLGVKGTTITGFDVNASITKTLRKPAEQLAAFKKAGKVKLRTFMDEIKAVDIKLHGRMGKDTIILKAIT